MPFQIFRPWLAHSAQARLRRRGLPQTRPVLATWAFSAALSIVTPSGVVTPLVLGLGLGTACESTRAALFEDDDARRSILDLRTRIDGLNRDTLRRLEDLSARLERLEAASGGQLTLANRIEALRQEIERLRGELEIQTNELAATQRRLRDQYAEVDSRVKRFEPIQVMVDGQSFSVDPMERRAFDGALSLFRAGEFRNALISFDSLIANYPQTPYAIQAAYWAGSAQYALKDWKSAAETLQALIRRNPNHPRVPDASLRLGAALLEQGDYRLARRTWESLIERFPTSPQAAEARERLPSAVEPPTTAPGSASPGGPTSEQPGNATVGANGPAPGSGPAIAPLPPSVGSLPGAATQSPSNAPANRVQPPPAAQPPAQQPAPVNKKR
ncbi:MAG: tol-pal system protein YbgF [Betaproteobacteria bacterium]|nr:tol-pal system protein YbgF [Betaproteobacteria bacterium]